MIEIFVAWFTNFYQSLIQKLPEIFVAVIVIIVFYFIARFVSFVIRKSLRRIIKTRSGLARLASGSAFVIVLIVGFIIALNVLNLSQAVTSVLAGVGIAGIALGFAFQDIAANYISGVILAIQRPFKEGDLLETNSHMGKVKNIDLRSTEIITMDGLNVIIPNKDVLQSALTNYTRTNDRRVDFIVGVSYASDLEKVKKLTINAVKKVKPRNEKKDVELLYDEFADSSINFIIRFWINESTQIAYRTAKSSAIMNIKKAYDKEGITIPFPIRTLDFGIKGGKTLSEMEITSKK